MFVGFQSELKLKALFEKSHEASILQSRKTCKDCNANCRFALDVKVAVGTLGVESFKGFRDSFGCRISWYSFCIVNAGS